MTYNWAACAGIVRTFDSKYHMPRDNSNWKKNENNGVSIAAHAIKWPCFDSFASKESGQSLEQYRHVSFFELNAIASLYLWRIVFFYCIFQIKSGNGRIFTFRHLIDGVDLIGLNTIGTQMKPWNFRLIDFWSKAYLTNDWLLALDQVLLDALSKRLADVLNKSAAKYDRLSHFKLSKSSPTNIWMRACHIDWWLEMLSLLWSIGKSD